MKGGAVASVSRLVSVTILNFVTLTLTDARVTGQTNGNRTGASVKPDGHDR